MAARPSAIARSKNRLLVGAAILGLFMLTGCTSPTATDAVSPSGQPSTSPSIAPVASATPTSTPTPTKPALDTLTVSPQGIDTVLLGSPVPTESASTAIVTYDDDHCKVWGAVGQPGVGIWLPNYSTSSVVTDGPNSFTVHTKGRVKSGIVTSLWVWSPKITTESGIHIDSSLAEVKAAYPHPSFLIHAALTDIYVIDKGTGRMVIEVGRSAGGEITAADIGKVLYLGVQPTSLKVSSIANVDGVAGCGE
jgi:hypothetical protein